MAGVNNTEVLQWLRSISDETINLEKRSARFHSMGFFSLRSLMYLKVTDIADIFAEDFTPLLLAEKRILERELEKLQIGNQGLARSVLKPLNENNGNSDKGMPTMTATTTNVGSSSHHTGTLAPKAPLEQKRNELSQNVEVLEVQIKSAGEHIKTLQTTYDNLQPLAAFRSRLCSKCHKPGHIKSSCTSSLCKDYRLCKVRDKHPELKSEIKQLQQELKQLEKQRDDSASELERFSLSRKRATANFFSVMRPRLRATNLVRYANRTHLDTDLLVLERALGKKIPEDESQDWQLPTIIEQFKSSRIHSLINTQY